MMTCSIDKCFGEPTGSSDVEITLKNDVITDQVLNNFKVSYVGCNNRFLEIISRLEDYNVDKNGAIKISLSDSMFHEGFEIAFYIRPSMDSRGLLLALEDSETNIEMRLRNNLSLSIRSSHGLIYRDLTKTLIKALRWNKITLQISVYKIRVFVDCKQILEYDNSYVTDWKNMQRMFLFGMSNDREIFNGDISGLRVLPYFFNQSKCSVNKCLTEERYSSFRPESDENKYTRSRYDEKDEFSQIIMSSTTVGQILHSINSTLQPTETSHPQVTITNNVTTLDWFFSDLQRKYLNMVLYNCQSESIVILSRNPNVIVNLNEQILLNSKNIFSEDGFLVQFYILLSDDSVLSSGPVTVMTFMSAIVGEISLKIQIDQKTKIKLIVDRKSEQTVYISNNIMLKENIWNKVELQISIAEIVLTVNCNFTQTVPNSALYDWQRLSRLRFLMDDQGAFFRGKLSAIAIVPLTQENNILYRSTCIMKSCFDRYNSDATTLLNIESGILSNHSLFIHTPKLTTAFITCLGRNIMSMSMISDKYSGTLTPVEISTDFESGLIISMYVRLAGTDDATSKNNNNRPLLILLNHNDDDYLRIQLTNESSLSIMIKRNFLKTEIDLKHEPLLVEKWNKIEIIATVDEIMLRINCAQTFNRPNDALLKWKELNRLLLLTDPSNFDTSKKTELANVQINSWISSQDSCTPDSCLMVPLSDIFTTSSIYSSTSTWKKKPGYNYGTKGFPGVIGDRGERGRQGPPGLKGFRGDVGPAGMKGNKGDVGLRGSDGNPGVGGITVNGINGIIGSQGNPGIKGDKGNKGQNGTTGVMGLNGLRGKDGSKGYTGSMGEKGLEGSTGHRGQRGEQGNSGKQGKSGQSGSKGIKGLKGEKGTIGKTGLSGVDGSRGVIGLKGGKGIKGKLGAVGKSSNIAGSKGLLGISGIIGDDGPIGLKGKPGKIGEKGQKGSEGIQGNIGITGSKGSIGLIGLVGDKGLRGKEGVVGSKGISAIEGPKGSDGEKGEIGHPGPMGLPGVRGSSGPLGVIGEPGLPGIKGEQGQRGPSLSGIKGIIGKEGPRGEPGEKGNNGLKGNVGDKGANGLVGDKGEKGPIGISLKGKVGDMGEIGMNGNKGMNGNQGVRGELGPIGLLGFAGPLGQKGMKGAIGEVGDGGEPGPNGLLGTFILTGLSTNMLQNISDSLLKFYNESTDSMNFTTVKVDSFNRLKRIYEQLSVHKNERGTSKNWPITSCKDFVLQNQGSAPLSVWLDPNEGSPEDSIRADCKKRKPNSNKVETNSSLTCISSTYESGDLLTYLKPYDQDVTWQSELRLDGLVLSPPDLRKGYPHISQLHFLQMRSNYAEQEIEFLCEESIVYADVSNGDESLQYATAFHTLDDNYVDLTNGISLGPAYGYMDRKVFMFDQDRTVFNVTVLYDECKYKGAGTFTKMLLSTNKPQMLPIVDFRIKYFKENGKCILGANIHPVCFE